MHRFVADGTLSPSFLSQRQIVQHASPTVDVAATSYLSCPIKTVLVNEVGRRTSKVLSTFDAQYLQRKLFMDCVHFSDIESRIEACIKQIFKETTHQQQGEINRSGRTELRG